MIILKSNQITMIKQIILLLFIDLISIIYNKYIFPFIINYISYEYYNIGIIFMLILTQIDNFTIYNDYINLINKYKNVPTPIQSPTIEPLKDHKINGIILNYLTYISNKQDEIYKMNIKKKRFNNRISRSYNNLNDI